MKRIAYLGLGIMGSRMAANLLKAGYDVTVWNRNPESCKPLVEQGATQAQTPAKAVENAEAIVYCLANDNAVEEVVFGQDGILSNVRSGQIGIDMSTVHPDTSRRQAAAYAEKQVEFLDAPVFGSKNESAAGGLWIVVGGKRDVFEQVKPILEPLSETIHYLGDTGKGTSMKLIGNSIVATQIQALGEAMVLATKAGLNPKDVLDVLHVVDFRSPIFDGMGKMLVERNFTPSFALKHMLKDANLIARFAQDLNSPTPAAAIVRETIKAAVNQGWGEENASALIKALELEAAVTVQ
ncbi:NAD(P)-dependent oxidoreductase [Brasilonema octagenarum UFV-E1]|uniref:NAD(P)-dependent oxidoreductase n=2 Tax=Brasilonema TaxID=383614 RepID=A0A856MDB8_9CYAN|nr:MULTISPECIES: NAD(P)-dependent oxidoreductase [Brasilonema]NMF67314.1 NAD(P)-dependent oxidoreductase [Brasilonema octagenarum UFV-OR1]QDL09285.1 NAD(P)-dependent oxidoreductase [Brasilonema sennae CENA114]QDL15642.1 NAD(P)-dependent oxidoreductase [Brasilonema octagenarum UFV-E1]